MTRWFFKTGVLCIVLVALTVGGFGVPFQQAPPTAGMYRATAYTLRGGEWQLGAGMGFPLASPNYWVASVSVAYGISSWFQAGITVSYGVQPSPSPAYMTYSLSAKLRLPLGAGLDLGMPFGIGFQDRGVGIVFSHLQGGAVASIRMGAGLTLHGGAALGVTKGGGWYARPYAIADLDLLPNLKLVGEVGIIPVSAAVGAWLRLLDFLDVRLALTPVPLSPSVGVYLRL